MAKRTSKIKHVKKSAKQKKPASKPPYFLIAVLLGVVILAQLSSKMEPDTVRVARLRLDNSRVSFNLVHSYSAERECYAFIELFKGDVQIGNESRSLGIIDPGVQVSRTIEVDFPERGVDFQIDIMCNDND
ncbi:MAG: hypothetical protein ABIG95_06730 [Candidatus Woesearchaeota archaeon]